MARITEDLVRMKSEHNNCEITTLEELSLHQQDIERIEHLDRWCKDLKILYLQSNLISKIENVGRLKKLEYLNLALNNVTKIENLRGCERLQKLDLTINFVDDLLTIDSLIYNECLTEIYLTGNPCTDYKGYREYVIATLPQLKWLDGKEISRSERITATQKLPQLRASIQEQQLEYQLKKKEEKEQEEEREKNKSKPGFNSRWYTDPNAHLTNETEVEKDNNEVDEDKFMNEPSLYTPESRVSLHKHLAEKRKDSTVQKSDGPHEVKRERKLERNGVMLNVNEGKYDFKLKDDEDNNQLILDVSCPRFMDTSLIDCEVQPTYVRVTIKDKILQLLLQDEVSPDSSNAQRSQATGHLVVTMPKVKDVMRPTFSRVTRPVCSHSLVNEPVKGRTSGVELLEVHENVKGLFDIVTDERETNCVTNNNNVTVVPDELTDEEPSFIDDPNVPPLI